MSLVTSTFTFTGDENSLRIINEILMDPASYNHAKIMANDGKEFYIEYNYQCEANGEIVAIGSGYVDSEEGEY